MTNTIKDRQDRFAYLDLAKGLCLIFIIIGHIGLIESNYIIYYFSFPLFLVLSGFFSPVTGSYGAFFKNRFLKICAPFLFFYLVSYIFFYIGMYYYPELIKTEAKGIYDAFNQRQWFNGPIWYLLCLLWTSIWAFLIIKIVQKKWIQSIIVIIIGCFGAYLGEKYIYLPLMIDVSMTALPFYFFGYLLKNTNILVNRRRTKSDIVWSIGLFVLVLVLCLLMPNNRVGFHTNTIEGSYLLSIVITIPAVFSVLMLCRYINTLPFITFFGAFSIVPFSIHHLIYRPLIIFAEPFPEPFRLWIVAIITVVLCGCLIPLFRNYLPWAIGVRRK